MGSAAALPGLRVSPLAVSLNRLFCKCCSFRFFCLRPSGSSLPNHFESVRRPFPTFLCCLQPCIQLCPFLGSLHGNFAFTLAPLPCPVSAARALPTQVRALLLCAQERWLDISDHLTLSVPRSQRHSVAITAWKTGRWALTSQCSPTL